MEKLSSLDANTYEPWKAIASDYVEKMLGKESDQYKVISTYSFVRYFYNPYTPQVKAQIPKLKEIVSNCIQSVEHYGVKKKECRHILITTHPAITGRFLQLYAAAFLFLVSLQQIKVAMLPAK